MKQRKMVAVVFVAACGGLAFTLWAANLTLDQIPQAAREALQKLAGENKILAVEAEKEHGIQVYEAKWVANGTRTEAEVTADGALLEMEESIKPGAVPEAVRAAAEKALAGAEKITYERQTVVFYEAEAKIDGKEKEVKISPAGKLMGEEEDEADDEDDDANKEGDK